MSNLVLRVALAACVFLRSDKQSAPEQHPFPLDGGTVWVYKGFVRWTAIGEEPTVTTTQVEWRTEVRRVIQHGTLRAAIVRGFPADLDWSDGRPQAQNSLVVESEGKFYLLTGNFDESIRLLEQSPNSLAGPLNEGDVFLQWPLKTNTKFSCDPDSMSRPDNLYCWFVATARIAPLQSVAGVSSGKRPEFHLQYVTLPDHIEFTFVPGIGITSYSYHHHGTVADTELKLVEFRPGKPE